MIDTVVGGLVKTQRLLFVGVDTSTYHHVIHLYFINLSYRQECTMGSTSSYHNDLLLICYEYFVARADLVHHSICVQLRTRTPCLRACSPWNIIWMSGLD